MKRYLKDFLFCLYWEKGDQTIRITTSPTLMCRTLDLREVHSLYFTLILGFYLDTDDYIMIKYPKFRTSLDWLQVKTVYKKNSLFSFEQTPIYQNQTISPLLQNEGLQLSCHKENSINSAG